MSEPSANGGANGDGRDDRGRFLPGNKGGPGNPHAATVGKHRRAFFAALRDDDVEKALAVVRTIMEDGTARPADRLAAAKELLDRVLGRPEQVLVLDKLAALERELGLSNDETEIP